jgi:hypothetical protein
MTTDSLPSLGKQRVNVHKAIIQVRQDGGPPKEIMTLSEYWTPLVGHIFFISGRGFEVQEVSTFFHVDGVPGYSSMTAVIDVKPRPEL